MSQYAFTLPLTPVYSEDNFFLSNCNRDAYQWVTAWPNWPSYGLLLHGPSASGKSHLGQIWQRRAGANLLDVTELPTADALKSHALIENIERLTDERALFHLLNQAKESSFSLLLTSTLPPKQLPFTLPDLTSRLLGLPAVAIAAPDDEALAAIMRKQFSDRQLKVEEGVIAYLLPRMDRSFIRINELVETLDHEALVEHKNLTIPFLKQILGW